MKLKVDNTQSDDWEPCPAGVFDFVCVQVCDMGLQLTNYGDKRQIRLAFETSIGGKEYLVGQNYNLSLHSRATLRKHLEGWRNQAFQDGDELEIENLAGKPCKIQIIHNQVAQTDGSYRTYANIGAIMPPEKGQKPHANCAPIVIYTAETRENINDMPDWLSVKIGEGISRMEKANEQKKANAYAQAKAGAVDQNQALADELDDEIPF